MTTTPSPPADRERLTPARRGRLPTGGILALALLLILLGACAPATESVEAPAPTPAPTASELGSDPAFETPQAQQVETAAQEAFHRMEIGLLRNGAYDTTPLVDLLLPQGTRWTVVDFSGDAYTLRFSSDALPGIAWEVSPDGVRRIRG